VNAAEVRISCNSVSIPVASATAHECEKAKEAKKAEVDSDLGARERSLSTGISISRMRMCHEVVHTVRRFGLAAGTQRGFVLKEGMKDDGYLWIIVRWEWLPDISPECTNHKVGTEAYHMPSWPSAVSPHTSHGWHADLTSDTRPVAIVCRLQRQRLQADNFQWRRL
jgi:hypothetical protein